MTADYTLTLTTATQNLGSVLTTGDKLASARFVSFQADSANTHVIYVGGNNHGALVSSSSYGFRIEAPNNEIPPAPTVLELATGVIDLSEFWVSGTNTEKLHIFVKL